MRTLIVTVALAPIAMKAIVKIKDNDSIASIAITSKEEDEVEAIVSSEGENAVIESTETPVEDKQA